MGITELVAILIEALDLSHTDASEAKARQIIHKILTTMVAALRRGEEIRIHGFGILRVKQRQNRTHHPFGYGAFGNQSPVTVIIPSRKAVTFRPATGIMAHLNKDTPTYDERRHLERVKRWTEKHADNNPRPSDT